MRLTQITVQNFLGLPDFRHALAAPVLFVAGPNGAGKSSLQDAVRFALTGELARGITKVGDRPQLITEGAAAGFAQVTVDGYEIRRNIGSGKVSGDAPQYPDALALCLDAPRFAVLPESERRSLLFQLAGVQVNRATVAEQLGAQGVADDIIERVLPLLRDGFPAAAAFAKDQASQAKGAWKAITREAYGTKKAETWMQHVPEGAPTAEELEKARALVQDTEDRVQTLSEAKGRAAGAIAPAKRAELEELALTIEARARAVEDAQRAHDAARDALNAAQRQAALAGETRYCCPACSAELVIDGAALIRAPEKAPARGQQGAMKQKQQDEALAGVALRNAREALRAAEAAQTTLDTLPPPPSPEDLAAAAQLDAARHDLDLYRGALRSLDADRRSAEDALAATERAKAEHQRVLAWLQAEELLGPDGIPATLLSRALDPINDALAGQAAAAGFRPARIERDLTLTYAGRPYALCSESERWRADALFAVVVAVMSGVRLVALDRFDVLDPGSRVDAIDWLAQLTQDALDTAIVTGTLKAKPDLGEGIDTVWLEGRGDALQAAA